MSFSVGLSFMTADVFTLFARSANLEEGIGRTIGEGKWGKGEGEKDDSVYERCEHMEKSNI